MLRSALSEVGQLASSHITLYDLQCVIISTGICYLNDVIKEMDVRAEEVHVMPTNVYHQRHFSSTRGSFQGAKGFRLHIRHYIRDCK